ncbi:MAG TPA: TatD family hydrolase [Anaerolineae bacterium]|nr:TatD family hydrolase [Anaerolineae bacterium]
MNSDYTPLADTHCHLTLPHFDQDRQQVLTRAKDQGVNRILVPGLDLASSRLAVELSQRHPEIYAAVGIHPHNAKDWDHSTKQELRELTQSPKVVAIGEIGLDYFRDLSPRGKQRTVFQTQLDLALEMELPVVIHNRDAIDDLMSCIETWSARLPATLKNGSGVLHANSADMENTCRVIEIGFYIGVAGPITYQKAEILRKLTAELPLERVLLETDAPYLTPHPKRGKRNEPSYLQFIAQQCANIFEVGINTISTTTSQNATDLFSWNHECTENNLEE